MTMGRVAFLGLLWAAVACAWDAPIQPVTVCEVLKDLSSYSGKAIMVVGRFSFRKTGRWLSEESCEAKAGKAEPTESSQIWLAYNPKSAPRLSPVFEVDAVSLRQKVKAVKLHTALREFRFGSSDYDRWAMVYGRVEAKPAEVRLSLGGDAQKAEAPPAAARLSYCGEGVIVFLDNEE